MWAIPWLPILKKTSTASTPVSDDGAAHAKADVLASTFVYHNTTRKYVEAGGSWQIFIGG